MSETGTFHETGEAYYVKDDLEPRVAVTPAEKVHLEAEGWTPYEGKTPKTATRAATKSAPRTRKVEGTSTTIVADDDSTTK